MDISELGTSLLSCAQALGAVFLFAACLPLKEPRAARAVAAALCFLSWSALTSLAMPLVMNSDAWWLHSGTWVFALIVFLGITLIIFDASLPAALYCATSGYTLQNLVSGVGATANQITGIPDTVGTGGIVNMIVPYAIVYAIVYVLVIKPRVTRAGLELMRLNTMTGMLLVVIFAVIVYDVLLKRLYSFGLSTEYLVATRLSHVALCIFILMLEYELLYNRRLQVEVATTERAMQAQREQYELSRDTIDAINIKCHDIRHQIRTLVGGGAAVDPTVLAEIEQAVNVYDSGVRTGNEPLDLILSEKGLICNREGVSLACIADGEALAFMAPADLYALMGNALDNAIEAVRQVADPERRSISVGVRRAGDMAVVHVENYFAGDLELADGRLPQTTKADRANHGFGMKSMKLIAQRYGGTLHTRVQGNVFHLNVSMPAA